MRSGRKAGRCPRRSGAIVPLRQENRPSRNNHHIANARSCQTDWRGRNRDVISRQRHAKRTMLMVPRFMPGSMVLFSIRMRRMRMVGTATGNRTIHPIASDKKLETMVSQTVANKHRQCHPGGPHTKKRNNRILSNTALTEHSIQPYHPGPPPRNLNENDIWEYYGQS